MKDSNVSRTRAFSPGRDEQDLIKYGAGKDKDLLRTIHDARGQAYLKALDALGRYKFEMFGYHASAWVKYNQLMPKRYKLGNPFREFVKLARGES
jgi:hypothetical protein